MALLLALAIAGCGDGETSTSAEGGDTELTVRFDVDGDGGKEPEEATITCPGDDSAACDAIDALQPDPTAPTSPEQPCTQVYGGPETLSVEGTLRGESVSASFTRTDGCEIARFDRFADVMAAVFDSYRGPTSSPSG